MLAGDAVLDSAAMIRPRSPSQARLPWISFFAAFANVSRSWWPVPNDPISFRREWPTQGGPVAGIAAGLERAHAGHRAVSAEMSWVEDIDTSQDLRRPRSAWATSGVGTPLSGTDEFTNNEPGANPMMQTWIEAVPAERDLPLRSMSM